jgi:hypothetical protein
MHVAIKSLNERHHYLKKQNERGDIFRVVIPAGLRKVWCVLIPHDSESSVANKQYYPISDLVSFVLPCEDGRNANRGTDR